MSSLRSNLTFVFFSKKLIYAIISHTKMNRDFKEVIDIRGNTNGKTGPAHETLF